MEVRSRSLRLPGVARLIHGFPRVIVADLVRAAGELPDRPQPTTVTVRMEGLVAGEAVLELVPHPIPAGGHRYSVRCPAPGCRSLRRHLYVVAGALTCRLCAGLMYASWALNKGWRRSSIR